MGVTYKLKQEVVDFIVQKKQSDPSLSCRKLVTLLQSAFQLDVSKSSINAIIKEFNLSNPVGRRSDKAPKNFFIPSERKQQLLAQVVPFLPQAAEPAVAVHESIPPVAVKEEPIHLAPDLITPTPLLKEGIKEQVDWSDAEGPLVENMGFFFVRAFMQDVLRRPLLGQVLAHFAGMEDRDVKLLEAAVFLKAMGISSVGGIQDPEHRALATMFEADPKKLEDLLGGFLGKSLPLNALSVALETELGTAFVQGAFLKCGTGTGRSFYLSADLGSFLSGEEGGRGCPIFKAIERAVDRLLTGRKPLVFDLSQGLDPASQEFLAFLDSKEKDRLDKIELWSNGSVNLWNYVLKVDRKYKFIAEICFNVGRYVCFEKIGDLCVHEDAVLGHFYELEEGLCVIDQEKGLKLRAILIGKRGQDKKILLLTNILEKDLTKIQILENYLENKGGISDLLHNNDKNSDESHIFVGNMFKSRTLIDKSSILDTLLGAIFESFETYAAQALCIGSDVMRKLYPVAARVRYQESLVHVRFEVEEGFPYFLQIQAAVEYVNCFSIRDYLGRRICFSVFASTEK